MSILYTERTIRENLIEELVLFAHGTAKTASAIRFRLVRRSDKGKTLESASYLQWYTMLYRLDRCFTYSECLQLLPNPRTITDLFETASHGPIHAKFIRGTFSVNTRDTRLGHPAIRSFISVDRKNAYGCLSSWLHQREPHPALIGIFSWYTGLCHLDGCKVARGKWCTNF